MTDLDLKNLLLESVPIRPGQEERAWLRLQDRLRGTSSRWGWLFLPTWRSLGYTGAALFLAVAIFDLGATMRPSRHAFVFADSQSPAVYATSFYSNSAQAQVVWLNGMEPASDQPTYLDPTSAIRARPAAAHTGRAPDSL